MLRRTVLVAALFSFASVLPAFAGPILLTYTFTGSPGNQLSEPVDAQPLNATASAITRGSGVTASAGLHSINSSGWTTAAAPDLLGDFYEFTLGPDLGFELDVTGLTFTFRRSATGPRNLQVRSSVDAFASSFFDIVVADVTSNFRMGTTDFSGLGGALNLINPVTFRIYGFASEGAAGTLRLGIDAGSANAGQLAALNNLQIEGDVSPVAVPEPVSLLLFSTGVAGVIIRRRRTH